MPAYDASSESSERLERIRLSHYRSSRAGLEPSAPPCIVTEDFDPESRLVAAANPVLRSLAAALDGMMAGGLLTDRNGTIVDRYFGDAAMGDASDGLGAVLGASFSEERTGTNAISVPLETRAPILIRSQEHYLDELKGFTCYGVPILNPTTHRLEGVLDLMVEEVAPPALMTSLLDRAAYEITGRLLGDYNPEIAISVAAFKSLSGRTKDGITLIARDFIVHNLRASDLVTGDDADLLRKLAGRLGPDCAEEILLASGVGVTVTAAPSGTDEAVLLRLSDGNRQHAPIPRRSKLSVALETSIDHQAREAAATTSSVFIVGERGSGRTRAADLVLQGGEVVRIDAARQGVDSVWERLQTLSTRADDSAETVLIEHADLLASDVCQTVIDLTRARRSLRLIATAAPSFAARPEIEYLASTCSTWIEIPSLRQRGSDFALIVEQIVEDISTQRQIPAGCRPGITKPTVVHLKELPWPGNVAELRSVLETIIERRSVGDIVISDLPERYRRATSAPMNLTLIEQAERNLIISTLSATGGNKVQTAQQLGMSRSTLYDRIRQFKIAFH